MMRIAGSIVYFFYSKCEGFAKLCYWLRWSVPTMNTFGVTFGKLSLTSAKIYVNQ